MSVREAETPSVDRLKTPEPCRVSEDGKWTLPAHGGRLKRTNENKVGGRPKEVIRDRMRKAYDTLALPTMERILRDEKTSDELKAKVAADLARICIGTDDKVQLQDREATLKALARATLEVRMPDGSPIPDDMAAKLLDVTGRELGIE